MARSQRTPESEDPSGGPLYGVGSRGLLAAELSLDVQEWADPAPMDDSVHGLVIFDKDLRVQYVNRQARRMMERDGSFHTEFDPQASLSLHVVKVATRCRSGGSSILPNRMLNCVFNTRSDCAIRMSR